MKYKSCKLSITCIGFSLTALLVGEKLPPDAEIDVSSTLIAFNLLE